MQWEASDVNGAKSRNVRPKKGKRKYQRVMLILTSPNDS